MKKNELKQEYKQVQDNSAGSSCEEIVREGARKLFQMAVEKEVTYSNNKLMRIFLGIKEKIST